MPRQEIDTLIVGQGLAGTLLSWELRKRGIGFMVIDNSHRESSSMIAAGLINPVSGPRMVLTPGFDAFYTDAIAAYQELENYLHDRFFFELPVIRVFAKASERVYWDQKRRLKTNLPFVRTSHAPSHWPDIHDPLGSVEFTKSGYCDTRKLITAYAKFLKDQNLLIEEAVNYDDILIKDHHVEWKNWNAKRLIFCEGWQAQNNPWFKSLPFNNAKGEVLTLSIKDHHWPEYIFNNGKWILPTGQQFRAGSTFTWDRLDHIPTEEGKQEILASLQSLLKKPVEVVDHKAGIRPIFKDLKPRAEFHPDHPQLGIFNGLGSKGVLIGPSYAKNFAQTL